MSTPTTNTERRTFFKKAGLGALAAGLLSALPLNLFSRTNAPKNNEQRSSVSIRINPMAVKREKK